MWITFHNDSLWIVKYWFRIQLKIFISSKLPFHMCMRVYFALFRKKIFNNLLALTSAPKSYNKKKMRNHILLHIANCSTLHSHSRFTHVDGTWHMQIKSNQFQISAKRKLKMWLFSSFSLSVSAFSAKVICHTHAESKKFTMTSC